MPHHLKFFTAVLAALIPCLRVAGADILLDRLTLGDPSSENAHAVEATRSEMVVGALGEPARRLLPEQPASWQGGRVAFTVKVDPEEQNYLTVRLWGSDTVPCILLLYCEGKQVGYRHLGDIEAFDIGDGQPGYNGRFFYRTAPLPLDITNGKTELKCEIRSSGPIWGYGQTFEKYQKPMTEPTRGIYRLYSHTSGFFEPPADEKQGEVPAVRVREQPGRKVLAEVKDRVNGEIDKLMRSERPLNQMQMQFLAKAYYVKWTNAYHNNGVVRHILEGGDTLYLAFSNDQKVAEFGPATYNPDWFGLGPVGDCVWMLADKMEQHFDAKIADGKGGKIIRREAWTAMLRHSRDWHRQHRRLYTNQSMINDLYIYAANRGIAVLDPASALKEEDAKRYLYESIGLIPWLGSEDAAGTPLKPVGENYLQLTAKGLTKELGYVGNYGEVLDWVTQLYDVTRPKPGEPGDEKIKAQLEKIANARAVFRHPAQDAEGYRAMRLESVVGWRDTHYPGDVVYGERTSWEGSALYSASATLDPRAVGYAQQMFEDNQFFASVAERMKERMFRVTAGLLGVPDQYDRLKAQAPSPYRLPMAPGQPDFVFSDEEDGVVAIKHGDEILYASLYWRARNAVNFLGRVHFITPRFDRIAVLKEDIQYTPSGLKYRRRDWTNFGFANGGLKYPGDLHSAHAGEELPIAKIPDGVRFKAGDESVYAGKGDFYVLRYGRYTIAMNMSADRTFDFAVPLASIELGASGKSVTAGTVKKIAPRTTLVLRSPETPAAPMAP